MSPKECSAGANRERAGDVSRDLSFFLLLEAASQTVELAFFVSTPCVRLISCELFLLHEFHRHTRLSSFLACLRTDLMCDLLTSVVFPPR